MTNANFIKFATSEVNKYVLNHIDKGVTVWVQILLKVNFANP